MVPSFFLPKAGDTRRYFTVDLQNKLMVADYIYAEGPKSLTVGGANKSPLSATTYANDRLMPQAPAAKPENLSWIVSRIIPVESFVKELGQQRMAAIEARRKKETIDNALLVADVVASIVLLAFPAAFLAKSLATTVKIIDAAVAISDDEIAGVVTDEIISRLVPKGIQYIVPAFNPGMFVRIGGFKKAVLRNAIGNDAAMDFGYKAFKSAVAIDMSGVDKLDRELYVVHLIRLERDASYREQLRLGMEQLKTIALANAQRTGAAPTFGAQPFGKPAAGKPSGFENFKFNPGGSKFPTGR